MRVRVLYEVTVEGVKYLPGVVEVKGTVGLDLLRWHQGNFAAVEEEKPSTRRAPRAERGHGEEETQVGKLALQGEEEGKEEE